MIRTGQEYLASLRENPPHILFQGERVQDPTTHPQFRGVARSMAALYDMQRERIDELTFQRDGERFAASHLRPESLDELRFRGRAYKVWADAHLGFMGRTPDYLNAVLMACAASASFFGDRAQAVRDYAAYVAKHDLATTHALTNPQVNRALGPGQLPDPFLAVGVVRETDRGIVVRGARMTATFPLAEELLVFPSTLLKAGEGNEPYALAFAVSTRTPGLLFVCREGLAGENRFDHPLASRFEEMDALVVFDDVEVPWERVFVYRDVERCNALFAETGALCHMAHQVVVLKTAKTETFLGLACAMAEAIGADGFPHVQEKIAEIIVALEGMRAFWTRAEVEAKENRYGLLVPDRAALDGARNLYPRLYPRLREILQLLGASGLVTLPSEKDFASEAAAYLERFLQGKGVSGKDRVALFRLAWDATLSGFGARQEIYERFFFGDPVRMHQTLFQVYPKAPYVERVRRFLEQSHEAAGV